MIFSSFGSPYDSWYDIHKLSDLSWINFSVKKNEKVNSYLSVYTLKASFIFYTQNWSSWGSFPLLLVEYALTVKWESHVLLAPNS